MLDDRVEQQRSDGAGRGAHGGIVMMMALTVSGAFPSGSMVTAACPVTVGFLATGGGGGVLPCAWMQATKACRVVVVG